MLAGHPLLVAQAVTGSTPPSGTASPRLTNGANQPPDTPQPDPAQVPDLTGIPFAVPLPSGQTDRLDENSDQLSIHGDLRLLSGSVDITFRGHEIRADFIQFNRKTMEATAQGHVRVTSTENDEDIKASHATYNVRTGVGRFYDVSGSVGLHLQSAPSTTLTASGNPAARLGLESPNPFLFAGRIVEKTGPADYTVYDGWVTSCLLPRPDWLFSSHKLAVANGKAHASVSTFHLLGIPVLILPYLTAPTTAGQRESGLLIPVFGDSSTNGVTVGEEAYIVLGRSADMTVGSIYYSLRGFSETGTFRYKGLGDDFILGHFSALQDRGYTANNGVYVNQGGEDLSAAFRRQLSPNIRAVGDGEYLSSFIYREAFTSNFNQAVSSDITSIVYVTRQTDGFSLDARVDRYQGLKQVPINSQPGEEVHILHVPSFDFDGIDRAIPGTPLLWNIESSAAGLKRVEPGFASSGIVERFDVHPEISLPVHFDGWSVLASVGARETFYTRSQLPTSAPALAPVELTQSLNRADAEVQVEVRPPALERTFAVPEKLQNMFGTEVRHTLEPEVTYRDVSGVNNFLSVLRFDETDLVSDTNQLEYGLTQRLYFRPRTGGRNGGRTGSAPPTPPGCPAVSEASTARPDPGAARASNPEGATQGLPGSQASQAPDASAAARQNLSRLEQTVPAAAAASDEDAIPDVLTPGPYDSTDANGIPVASSDAPQTPLHTHSRRLARCTPPQAAQQALASWSLVQRYFFDPTFGNAVVLHRRNVFESTLSLSGIAFLTEPRNISPLVSRMRVRTSGHTDIEWDFDLDTGAKKFTGNNVFFNAHDGPVFGGISYARLNAPGRFATEVIDNGNASLQTSNLSNFSQIRLLLGYGVPSKPGLAVASNVGLDLLTGAIQYATLQTSYNWNCCGLAIEYQKFDLGNVRDENSYRFSFSLANLGSAGNIRNATRLF